MSRITEIAKIITWWYIISSEPKRTVSVSFRVVKELCQNENLSHNNLSSYILWWNVKKHAPKWKNLSGLHLKICYFHTGIKFYVSYFERREIMPAWNVILAYMWKYLKQSIVETKMKPAWNLMPIWVCMEQLPQTQRKLTKTTILPELKQSLRKRFEHRA